MKKTSQSLGVLILAAGKGTRMHSEKPKALQPLLEEPLVYYTLKAVQDAGLEHVAVVVGHQGECVEEYIRREWPGIAVVWQREQLGTGHAVQEAQSWWKDFDHLLVLSGDVPLIRTETITNMVEKHFAAHPECSFLSFTVDDPTGYGRVVRLADGGVRIVEHKDAMEEELLIHEINAGVYLFSTEALSAVIRQLGTNNEQNEYYLTDAIPMIGETEGDVNVIICEDCYELLGVNTPKDLAACAHALNKRILRKHMMKGLKCIDPATTWIGPRVALAPDVFLEPGVQLWGKTQVGNGSRVGAHSTLRDVQIGDHTAIHGPSVLSDVVVGNGAEVGPFAFMRGGAEMGDAAKVGRFVEIKNSKLGPGAKVPHLSYIGDASIGEGTNIGAATVTCNYDGKAKHRTIIGSGCFVGSDTMFVAPVTLGDNATTAAGSIITKDVPDGALAIARSRQTNIENWYDRKGIESKSGQPSTEGQKGD